MDTERIALHTSLIEQEEELLKRVVTCQIILAATWRNLQSSINGPLPDRSKSHFSYAKYPTKH